MMSLYAANLLNDSNDREDPWFWDESPYAERQRTAEIILLRRQSLCEDGLGTSFNRWRQRQGRKRYRKDVFTESAFSYAKCPVLCLITVRKRKCRRTFMRFTSCGACFKNSGYVCKRSTRARTSSSQIRIQARVSSLKGP